MKIPFTHFMHENKESGYEFADELITKHSLDLSGFQERDLAYSFYEVKLHCILDTDTMKVTIVGAE